MHQISMLGQHSDSAHYLRPDRVYRTSVLSPMTNFRPGQAVQAIAQDFTQGPRLGTTLRGLGQASVGDRFRLWWADVKARISGAMTAPTAIAPAALPAASQGPVAASVPQVHSPGASMPPTSQGYPRGGSLAPAYTAAEFLEPRFKHVPEKLISRAYGQSPSLPPFAEEAATKSTMMMWRGLRWPWG